MQLNKSITSGFERITSCVTSVISLDFCKSFEKVHLTSEIITKASNKTCILYNPHFVCVC